MQIKLLAVGTRMPDWVKTGFEFYSRRLPEHCRLNLVEIEAPRRMQSNIKRARCDEGRRLLTAVPKNTTVVALDESGKQFTTKQLAQELDRWMRSGNDVTLMVGGPDGLAQECLDTATSLWSLSALTFPHALVRVVIAEQLYRAWTVLTNHPYHRE